MGPRCQQPLFAVKRLAVKRCSRGITGRLDRSFTAAQRSALPSFAYVIIRPPTGGDVIRSFLNRGGRPAHMLAMRPTRDGSVMVDADRPRTGQHNRLSL